MFDSQSQFAQRIQDLDLYIRKILFPRLTVWLTRSPRCNHPSVPHETKPLLRRRRIAGRCHPVSLPCVTMTGMLTYLLNLDAAQVMEAYSQPNSIVRDKQKASAMMGKCIPIILRHYITTVN